MILKGLHHHKQFHVYQCGVSSILRMEVWKADWSVLFTFERGTSVSSLFKKSLKTNFDGPKILDHLFKRTHFRFNALLPKKFKNRIKTEDIKFLESPSKSNAKQENK